MNLVRKRGLTRIAATAIAAGLLGTGALVTATTATADETPQQPQGATATLGSLVTFGSIDVTTRNGETDDYNGGLFEMTSDSGGTFLTYCIDLFTKTKPEARYQEVDWDASKLHDNADAGKIQWVLQNAFPVVSADELAGAAGVESLEDAQAAAATQAAIWELSDGVDAVPQDDTAAEVTEWLLENATDAEEPGASLSLTPATVAGQPGGLAGPVTVGTTADTVTAVLDEAATAAGLSVVDAGGAPVGLENLHDGDQLFFSVPEGAEDGAGALTATASSAVSIGRVFTGVGQVTQTMILAGTESTSIQAGAGVTWTSPGSPAPAAHFEEKCAEGGGGIEVTITNGGDAPGTYTVGGQTVEVAPGETSEPVFMQGEEDTELTVQVTDAEGGVVGEHTVTVDCAPAQTETPAAPPADETGNTPAPAGGTEDDSEDLAATGSSTNPALFGGIAVGLLVVGGAVVFLVRRRGARGND
ncbi:Cys-Gln thioester bond-forming surface protein [Streptomyces sp. NPDC049881]|uniref:Cys-Gln thioester bond-forming surface protein n=1 Tax=Streptomyces sp. NPDC049881 TaxID=3155778 RepID=UPI00343B2EC9